MKFNTASTSITILEKYQKEFTQYMAVKVPELQQWLTDKQFAVPFAVECAIRDHPDWFEFFFHQFRRDAKFYGKDPDFIIRERVTQGLTRMEVIA
ncbi:MAG: hypothetical protein LUQ50_12755 [Methanospirillum sp.]|uniref:hypothetical protein n=1 Tax=Methanospirillum sp. TaxID=45200 RepID=UPI0023706120|nr:hypothetical protein [Methanospirillum sp.]MDD1729924.1 hypothetical protein [Methanospirillum sp.]